MVDENVEYDLKKREIAAKFKEYFFNFGMVDTIITQVTSDMHISKKTFYKYFKGGKQECLYYIFALIAEESLTELTLKNLGDSSFQDQFHSMLKHIFPIVIPFVAGNKAQIEADFLLENQIVGEAFKDIFGPVIKNLLMQGKDAGEFKFRDLDLIYDAVTALIRNSMVSIHQNLASAEKLLEIEDETIKLILKILG
ncbi:MAG: TetR/AcrR family transcriptional regulator [Promethearchaeota archaeon]